MMVEFKRLLIFKLPLMATMILGAALWAAGAARADGVDPDLNPDLYKPPVSASKKKAAAPAKAKGKSQAVALPAPAGPPQELFQKGFYQAAYAGFQPQLAAGNPEAAFYALVIRRNGLDGRPPAAPAEMAGLWNTLTSRAEYMREALRDRQVSTATKSVYRTALAHLDYFGLAAPPWPPAAIRDAAAEKRAKAARREAAAAAADGFTPAMNFIAFLDYDLSLRDPKETFTHTLRAAEAGDFLAMGNLAWLYREGLGTDKNFLRAAHWARQGCNSAPPVPRNENEVGYCYETGHGVTRDLAEAAAWYQKSAARHHPAGRANAARLKSKAAGQAPSLDNWIVF